MNLTGESGLQRVLPLAAFKLAGGYKNLEILAATMSSKMGEWRAETKDKIIYLKFYGHTLAAGMHETDIGAQCDAVVVGGYTFLDKNITTPSTQQIIDFMKWKISEDQILEFSEY